MNKMACFLSGSLLASFLLAAEPHYTEVTSVCHYSMALVRELSPNFANSLKQDEPEAPIDIALARQQHAAYSALVAALVPQTVTLPGDPNHPDCNFIEDTAIIVGREAVISRMGAKERRGEEAAVREVLTGVGLEAIHEIQNPGTMDGGDILYTGRHLFVGISARTNREAAQQLEELFSGRLEVISIEVKGTLHLKSLISLIDEETIVVADDADGHAIMEQIRRAAPEYQFLLVPDRVASNVLRIHETVVIQAGFPKSEAIFRKYASENNVNLIPLEMSELIKADGALTCGSLLFPI